MSSPAIKNRWLIAASAMLIHLSIGSVYAYSVYQRPLQETQGWSIAGPTLVARIVELTGSYELVFYVVAGALCVGLGCVGVLRWWLRVVRQAGLRGTPHGRYR
jgi:hypothetical protein